MRLGGRLGGEGNVGVKAKRWNNKAGQVSSCAVCACAYLCLQAHALDRRPPTHALGTLLPAAELEFDISTRRAIAGRAAAAPRQKRHAIRAPIFPTFQGLPMK